MYGMASDASSREMQRRMQERNQPINEITALMSGSQVSMPNAPGLQRANIGGTDVGQNIYNTAALQQKQYEQQMAQHNQHLAGMYGLGQAAIGGAARYWGERKVTMTDYFPKTYGNRNPYFEALLKEGTNTSPIGAHSQGMSRLAFALLAGLERGQMDRQERGVRQPMQPKLGDINPAVGAVGPSMNVPPGGPSSAPAVPGAAPQQSAPEPGPYPASGPGAPLDFVSRWPPQGTFGSQRADWFSDISRQRRWEE